MINDSEKIEFYEEIKEQFKDEIIDEFVDKFSSWYVESEWYDIELNSVISYFRRVIY